MEYLLRKARFLEGVRMTEEPPTITYESLVLSETVRIALKFYALN